ncbi:MAG: hypothetical protein C4543_00400 [Ignavibacteriales bacterium]|jgi:hypothetical protein|nr:MAG: hypothetical protein C4543_00400 [Ignavibacteriales bacterium]
MKTIKIILMLFVMTGVAIAQSDYQKVESFKDEIAQLRLDIHNAKSLAELDSLRNTINSLKQKHLAEKDLLDKSMYPENYNSTFSKLQEAIDLRREDFTQIETLQTEVVTLKSELEILNEKNTELLSKIKEYQSIGGKDAQSINELKRLVANLRQSLKERDELVRSIVDSLLSDFVKSPMSLNEAERQQVFEKVETGNLLYNIEKTIRDNMEFLKATQLSAEDLGEVKEEQIQFHNMWKRIGPKLADVYMDKGEKAGEVAYITNLFAQWNQRLDREIWERVYQVFRSNNLKVTPFSNGNEFTNNVLEFIENEKISGSQESYITFEDSVWTEQLRTTWIPVLIDNEMITTEQRDTIQTAINNWEDMYGAETPIYWYVAIAIIVIVFLLIFIPKWKKKSKPLAEQ